MSGREVVRHFEIDGVLRFERGNPSRRFSPIAGDVHRPKLPVGDEAVGRAAGWRACAVQRNGRARPERAEAGIEDIARTVDGDGQNVCARGDWEAGTKTITRAA